MSFGTTPLSNVTIGNNQVPVSAVAVPNEVSGNLTALEGGPESTDGNGNKTAPASTYIKDGGNVAQGLIADAAVTGDTSGTVSAKLRGMNKTLAAAFLDTFGSAGNITAATTFSGIPTASQLVSNSWVFLANPGGQSTFMIALEVGSAFNGTISFYGLEPDATSLQLVLAHQRGATTIASSVAINVGAATNQIWVGNIANFKGVYAVCTAFTSGTISAQLGLSPAPYAMSVINTVNVTATQSGTWTVQPGNTQNTTPWLMAGPNANGVQAANTAGNVVIKGTPGWLYHAIITTLGTAGLTIFDNASTNSGTPLLVIPASAAVGTIYSFPSGARAVNGIVSAGVANCPAVTFHYT